MSEPVEDRFPQCGASLPMITAAPFHVCVARLGHGGPHVCGCGASFDLEPVSPNSGAE